MTKEVAKKEPEVSPNEVVQEVPEPKKLPNKKQIRLLFKYADRGEAKSLGAKWNSVEKNVVLSKCRWKSPRRITQIQM